MIAGIENTRGSGEVRFPPAPRQPAGDLTLAERLVLGAAVVTFAVLAWLASPGVRGSDQYWYVADVAALAEGRGPVTNNTFPPSVLPVLDTLPRPFVHNIPNLYLIAPLARLFGPFFAWVIGNVLATFVAGALIFAAVASLATKRAAMLAALVWLAMPVTFWQATQPLAEATLAPVVALAVFLCVRPSPGWRSWVGIAAAIGFLAACRTSMVVLIPLIPLAFALRDRRPMARRIILAGTLMAVSLGIVGLWSAFAEPNLRRGIFDFLRSGVPGTTGNMAPFLELEPGPLTAGMLVRKATYSVRTQFLAEPALQAFYLPFNALLVIYVGLVVRRRQVTAPDAAAAALVAAHFLTIVVFQNQFRYMVTVLPALIGAVAVGAHRSGWLGRRWVPTAAAASLLLVEIAVNAPVAGWIRADALREGRAREALSTAAASLVPADDRVVVEAKGRYLLIGYVLRPRPVLFVDSGYSAEQYDGLASGFGAEWLICRQGSAILQRVQAVATVPLRLPPPLQDFLLIRLASSAVLAGAGTPISSEVAARDGRAPVRMPEPWATLHLMHDRACRGPMWQACPRRGLNANA